MKFKVHAFITFIGMLISCIGVYLYVYSEATSRFEAYKSNVERQIYEAEHATEIEFYNKKKAVVLLVKAVAEKQLASQTARLEKVKFAYQKADIDTKNFMQKDDK